MKKQWIALLLLSFLVTAIPSKAKEPTNIAIARQNLIIYHESGSYERDISKVTTQALNYLEWRLDQHNFTGKPAVVFDIDETSLSNYKQLSSQHFTCLPGHDGCAFTADQPAIAPTLKLFKFAVAHNLAVFFVTGRHEKERELTETNLRNAGFTPWTRLFFRPDNAPNNGSAAYKSNIRKQLTKEGYDILLTIGDQQTDLSGGYADKTFKLPNPYYLVN